MDFTHIAYVPSPTIPWGHLISQKSNTENLTAPCTWFLSPFPCMSYVDFLLSQFVEAWNKLQPLPWKNSILQCNTMLNLETSLKHLHIGRILANILKPAKGMLITRQTGHDTVGFLLYCCRPHHISNK